MAQRFFVRPDQILSPTYHLDDTLDPLDHDATATTTKQTLDYIVSQLNQIIGKDRWEDPPDLDLNSITQIFISIGFAVTVWHASQPYAQGVNIPGVTFDLTKYSMNMVDPSGERADIVMYLNGQILIGGSDVDHRDIYPGDDLANGDVKFNRPKGILYDDFIVSMIGGGPMVPTP